MEENHVLVGRRIHVRTRIRRALPCAYPRGYGGAIRRGPSSHSGIQPVQPKLLLAPLHSVPEGGRFLVDRKGKEKITVEVLHHERHGTDYNSSHRGGADTQRKIGNASVTRGLAYSEPSDRGQYV